VVFGVALMVFKVVEALAALVVKVSVEAIFPLAGFIELDWGLDPLL
jgi:hypothetical protein